MITTHATEGGDVVSREIARMVPEFRRRREAVVNVKLSFGAVGVGDRVGEFFF